ncbi:MAG: RnfABCDGE type electron transport complex subunit D [Candidatus Omnitrophica bacterium]|nr:RnfABCDGE type electron transport complex subunit D [Candidatus Omnitrophota bacterium]
MDKFIVTSSPHLHKKESVRRIMWTVNMSLLPAAVAGVFIFGAGAAWIMALCILSAIISEAVLQKLTHRKISVLDGSAFLTGLLLAFNLPARVPFWIPIAGSFFAIAIGKQVFGGLGQNIFNPALAGRAFLTASWPKYVTTFTAPFSCDATTCATPLTLLKEGPGLDHLSYMDLFLGKKGGCIGEVCILALLIGAAYLFYKKYITWHIPLSYIAATALVIWIFGGKPLFSGDWFFHILSGGLILGAFFMATDYVTSPLTGKGQIIFGAGCGLLTAVLRIWGGSAEGVSYAILMMNAATPVIDRFTANRVYGS